MQSVARELSCSASSSQVLSVVIGRLGDGKRKEQIYKTANKEKFSVYFTELIKVCMNTGKRR